MRCKLIRIFNYNTLEKVHSIETHTDYIRSLVVHPTQPLLLSWGDNMVILKAVELGQQMGTAQSFHPYISYLYSYMRVYLCIRMWIIYVSI